MPFQVALAVDGLLFGEVRQLVFQRGHVAVTGDIGKFQEVAAVGLEFLDLLEQDLEIQAFRRTVVRAESMALSRSATMSTLADSETRLCWRL